MKSFDMFWVHLSTLRACNTRMLLFPPQYPLSAPSEVKLFFLPQIIPISEGIKMSDLQKHTTQQRFEPRHSCHLDKIVINWNIWRIICLSKSRRGYNLQIFCWLWPLCRCSKRCALYNLFEMSLSAHTWAVPAHTVHPHGKWLTSNSCSMTSVKPRQNPRLPLSQSAPPHRYRWLRLRTSAWGGGKKNNWGPISTVSTNTSSALFHAA